MQQNTRALFDNNVTDNGSDQVMKITDCIVDIHSRRLNFYSISRITSFSIIAMKKSLRSFV